MPLRRTIAFLVFIDVYLVTMLISGCQRTEPAAKTQAPVQTQAATAAPAPAATPTTPDPTAECAAGRGEQCGGGCKQWDSAAAEVQQRATPTDAEWHRFAVTGMHCGGCERRVIANVGNLPGVVGVEADAERGQVRVAIQKGATKAVDDAAQKIASLGFGVEPIQ